MCVFFAKRQLFPFLQASEKWEKGPSSGVRQPENGPKTAENGIFFRTGGGKWSGRGNFALRCAVFFRALYVPPPACRRSETGPLRRFPVLFRPLSGLFGAAGRTGRAEQDVSAVPRFPDAGRRLLRRASGLSVQTVGERPCPAVNLSAVRFARRACLPSPADEEAYARFSRHGE